MGHYLLKYDPGADLWTSENIQSKFQPTYIRLLRLKAKSITRPEIKIRRFTGLMILIHHPGKD